MKMQLRSSLLMNTVFLQVFIPILLAHLFCFQTDSFDAKGLAKFQKDLAKRVLRDQGVRIALIKCQKRLSKRKNSKSDDKELKRLEKRASDVDDENLAWLKKHVETHGFPSRSEIGEKSADEFYLLVLHADRDREFQKECVKLMKEMPKQWHLYIHRLERRSSFPSSRIFYARKADSKKAESKKTVGPSKPKAIAPSEPLFAQEPIPDKAK